MLFLVFNYWTMLTISCLSRLHNDETLATSGEVFYCLDLFCIIDIIIYCLKGLFVLPPYMVKLVVLLLLYCFSAVIRVLNLLIYL